MAIVTNPNLNRPLFQPMQATHTSLFVDHMYDGNEQETVQVLTDESIVLSGYMIYYVFRTEVEVDDILFEPDTSTFSEAFQIAATFPDYVNGWEGTDAFLNKFGFETNSQGEFIVSQRAWDTIMAEREAQGLYTSHRPREGDLIVMYNAQRNSPRTGLSNQSKIVFQITYIDKGKNNWQLGKDYVWRISASEYRYDQSENLTALDDDNQQLFDTITEFERTDQSDDYTQEEQTIKEFDETNPFGGY